MRNLLSITFLFIVFSINAQTINTNRVKSIFFDIDNDNKKDSVNLEIPFTFIISNDSIKIVKGNFLEGYKILSKTPYKQFNNYLYSVDSKGKTFEVNSEKKSVIVHKTNGTKDYYFD